MLAKQNPEQQSSFTVQTLPLGEQVLEPSLHEVMKVPEQLRPSQHAYPAPHDAPSPAQ